MAQREAVERLGEHDADGVADRRVDAADQPLKQPVPRKQRRSQRQAEEDGGDGDPAEVEAHQAPRPDDDGVTFDALPASWDVGDGFAGDG